MKVTNTPRWMLLFVAVLLTSVGFIVLVNANQNIARGPYFSPIPSPGYDGKFLAYSEVYIVGAMIAGVGIMLGLISIGVRRWPTYNPKEFYIDGIRTIGISIASMDYEKDKGVIQNVMRSAELIVHTKNEFSIGEPDFKMGWNFFILYVTPDLVHNVANHSAMQQMPQNVNDEDRFVNWLTEKLKENECNVYLDLESKKGSSKYGFF